MENEIMNYEATEEVVLAEVENKPGMSTGVAMLVGAGLMAATTAVVKLGKKAFHAWKARKAAQEEAEHFEEVE